MCHFDYISYKAEQGRGGVEERKYQICFFFPRGRGRGFNTDQKGDRLEKITHLNLLDIQAYFR